MGTLSFGYYFLTGNEGADFQVGSRPTLDEYGGFDDQELEGVKPGAQLFFLLEDGSVRPTSAVRSKRACRELRDGLDKMCMINGCLVGVPSAPFLFQVEQSESFFDMMQRKVFPDSNEALPEVARFKHHWEMTRDWRRQFGGSYRFQLICELPPFSSVEQALTQGLTCERRIDFGVRPAAPVNRGFPMFLEPLTSDCVRVIAIGDNYIDSCRVFDITDLKEYRNAISENLKMAELPEEVNFWKHLAN